MDLALRSGRVDTKKTHSGVDECLCCASVVFCLLYLDPCPTSCKQAHKSLQQ